MSSHAGVLAIGAFGWTLLGTPSTIGSAFDEDHKGDTDLESLRPKALDELEREYALSSSSPSPDACPANQLAWLYARRLIAALDRSDQPTDVYFDHTGAAVLEWRPRRGVAASLYVGGDSTLRFAVSRFGARQFGTADFSDVIPEPVLVAIRTATRR